MKRRILVFLLVAAIAAPAGARPASPVHRGWVWASVWGDVVDFVRSFRLFDASSVTEHGLPPPNCTTSSSFQ